MSKGTFAIMDFIQLDIYHRLMSKFFQTTLRRCLDILFFSIVLLCFSAALAHGRSATADPCVTEALALMTDTADEMCGEILQSGESEALSGSGKASASLRGLLGRLAELGLEGDLDVNAQQYSNVLRDQLAGELANARDCRVRLMERFFEDILPTICQDDGKFEPPADVRADLGVVGNAPSGESAIFYQTDSPHRYAFSRHDHCLMYFSKSSDEAAYISVFEHGKTLPFIDNRRLPHGPRRFYENLGPGLYLLEISFDDTTSYSLSLKNRKC